jgi:basic membrane protein A
VVEPGGGGPTGYGGLPIAGLRRAVRELGVEGRIVVLGVREDWEARLASLAAQRYDLIVTVTTLLIDAVRAVAPQFPRVRFAMIDAPYEFLGARRKNVAGTDFRTEETGYLAGYLAAKLETRRRGRDVISSVGGIKVPSVDAFIAGYQAGARKAAPGITTLNGYSGSFSDPAKCRALALSQIARGSGVVFNVAGTCGLGTLAAAKTKGVWGIGVDSDQSSLGPHILTSALKRFDVAAFKAVEALRNGRFPGGRNVVLGLRNRGVGLGKISPRVPRPFVRQVAQIRAKIVSGRIDIPTEVK